jgi:cell division topological specificity factor
MLEFFMRLFRGEASGQTAKERLRLVLLSDHLALAPDVVDALRADLLSVISRYVEVDEANVDVTFEQREHEVAMLANIPILSLKERPAAPALATVTSLPVVPAAGASANGAAANGTAAPETVAAEAVAAGAVPTEAVAAEVVAPEVGADAPPAPKPRKRRRRRAARAAARAQAEPVAPVETSAQA